MADRYDALKLENQFCFPLYACSNEIRKAYKPYLDELDLTYTQYITMMVMWEHRELRVKDISGYLRLNSSTLTPLLKRLEENGYVTRQRSARDARDLMIALTDRGEALKEKAVMTSGELSACVDFDQQKSQTLYALLYELLDKLTQ